VRNVLLVLLLVACTKTSERAATTGSAGSAAVAVAPVTPDAVQADAAAKPVRDGIAIPADHPTTDILITRHCSLSPHPPSTHYWSQATVYDLETRTWEGTSTQGHDRPSPPPRPLEPGEPDPDAPTVTKTKGTLPAAKLQTITTRLAELLSGGPYLPKYPRSGGSRCTLILAAKGKDPFFSIDRADNDIDDAVTRLMTSL
jgi:hypothetical protein